MFKITNWIPSQAGNDSVFVLDFGFRILDLFRICNLGFGASPCGVYLSVAVIWNVFSA
jgi:hypothetical protein